MKSLARTRPKRNGASGREGAALHPLFQRDEDSPRKTAMKELYRCPHCGRVWLLDGTQQHLDLHQAELEQVALELKRDLAALPEASCSICSISGINGQISMVELDKGKGYIVQYEGVHPRGAHLRARVMNLAWRKESLRLRRKPVVSTVDHYQLAHEFLSWLAQLVDPSEYALLTHEELQELTRVAVPGHGAPDTSHFVWRAASWEADCPPLGGPVYIMLAQAMPADDHWHISDIAMNWRRLAEALQGWRFSGEKVD